MFLRLLNNEFKMEETQNSLVDNISYEILVVGVHNGRYII
jgi:hypothetical protein